MILRTFRTLATALLLSCLNIVAAAQGVFPPKEKIYFPLYDTITISFIGDIMQHKPQIDAALAKGKGAKHDYTNSFRYIEPLIAQSDYMVANMELTIGTPPYSGYPMFSAPSEIAVQAKKSGIDLFLMANNHIADKGAKGLQRTLQCYKDLGVATLGVYENKEYEKEHNPLIVTIKGVRFALFNFTYDTNGMPVPQPYMVCLQDTAHIKEVVGRANEAGVDYIIALPHWGLEYQLQPSAQQKRLAEYMFSLGVDAIVGGHPHVPQNASIERDRVVFYSLGNYVSNQSNPPYTQIGMFVQLRFRINHLTKKSEMLPPRWLYTYCFRKGELENDYVVLPMTPFFDGKESNAASEIKNSKAMSIFKIFEKKSTINYNWN